MKMNEKEALFVIEQMIVNAKKELTDNGFYFTLWGWLVFIAAIINYYLLEFTAFTFHSLPWVILMPLGGIATFIGGIRDKKEEKVRTYLDEILNFVMHAFAISMFLVCFFMSIANQWQAFYPTIILVYAIWLYISGRMLNFKPLVYGAFLNWIMAATGYLMPSLSVHLILIAIAVLGGFIIPGYLLKRKYDKDVQRT